MALWEKMEGQPGTILGWLTFFESQSEEGRPKKNDNALTSLDIQWGYCALSQASQENAQSTSMYKWCSLQEWVDQGQPCLIASLPGLEYQRASSNFARPSYGVCQTTIVVGSSINSPTTKPLSFSPVKYHSCGKTWSDQHLRRLNHHFPNCVLATRTHVYIIYNI